MLRLNWSISLSNALTLLFRSIRCTASCARVTSVPSSFSCIGLSLLLLFRLLFGNFLFVRHLGLRHHVSGHIYLLIRLSNHSSTNRRSVEPPHTSCTKRL